MSGDGLSVPSPAPLDGGGGVPDPVPPGIVLLLEPRGLAGRGPDVLDIRQVLVNDTRHVESLHP